MRSQKLIFLFSFIFFTLVFVSKVFGYTTLDVSVVNNNLRINSCSSSLGQLIGYKGYINDIEIFTTGPAGGFPCYSGDLFINGLTSFISPHTPPIVLTFDFYATSSFESEITHHFAVYYDGLEFTTTPPPLPSCSDGIQNQDETGIDIGGVCEIIVPPPPIPACTEDCFSNVLFLPGLMGSRIYDEEGNELWVSRIEADDTDLLLDDQGKSIDTNLYTKNDGGVIDEIFSLNIYKSFINELKDWKEKEIIRDYALIPYDWRLSLEDIITNGAHVDGNISYTIPQDFSESFILNKLEELEKSSKSGKVTIVTHSNGGLVAKALVQKLKDTNHPLYEKIDKIIFVAVPQIGTPDAVLALLHGTELGPFGLFMKQEKTRQMSENMPTVYNLLPSTSYFETVDPSFATSKIVSFENVPFFDSQTSKYGVFVSNETELEDYILGLDGRIKPSFSDTKNPNIGNSYLYKQAEEMHEILDNWEPHGDTKVIQVAGWGAETISGLDYKVYRDTAERISYTPRFVIDGDSTVVVPSALWMPESSNVERWWVNLQELNNSFSLIKNVHRNILEITNLTNFIKAKVTDSDFSDPEYIVVDNTSTLTSSSSRLHFILHSPLTLGITDAEGNYTGMDPETKEVREEINGVDYRQIGEVQVLSVPTGTPYTLTLQGYEDGYFSLDVEEQLGNEIVESTLFEGIASSSSTLATMDIGLDFEVSDSELKVDTNGDEVVDQIYPIVEVEVLTTGVDTIKENNIETSRVSSGSERIGEPEPSIQNEEYKAEPQRENENLDIVQALGEDIENLQIETKSDEAEAQKESQGSEKSQLSASVADSGLNSNWILYVIILGVLTVLFLIKRFIKI